MDRPRQLASVALGCLSILLVASVGSAQFEFTTPANVISVTATGEAKAPPDLLKIQLSASTTAPLAADALAQNKKKVDDFLAQLAAIGVPNEAIETSGPCVRSSSPTYGGESVRASGFAAFETITITLKGDALKDAPGRTAAILDVASKVGAGAPGGVPPGMMGMPGMAPQLLGPGAALFTVSDPDALRAEALRDAVERARKSAEVAAKAMGVKLGSVRSAAVGWPGSFQGWYMPGLIPQDDVPSGTPTEATLRMTVTVQFDFTK